MSARVAVVAGFAAALAAACLPSDPPITEGIDCRDGRCECLDGLGDCNDDPSDGCEAVLASDPRHCGSCGRDCLGGGCDAGNCQAYEVAPGLIHADAVAAEGRQILFGETGLGAIVGVDDDGGALQLISGDELRGGEALLLALDGERALWDRNTNIGEALRSAARNGGPVLTLATADFIDAVALGNQRIAWAEYHFAGGARVKLATSDGAVEVSHNDGGLIPYLVLDGEDDALWVGVGPPDRIVRLQAGDGFPSLLHSTGELITGLAVVGPDVIWLEASSAGGGSIRRLRPGGEPEDLHLASAAPGCLSAVGEELFWVEGAPNATVPLFRMPAAGGPATQIATFVADRCPAIAAAVVVWVSAGRVHAIAR